MNKCDISILTLGLPLFVLSVCTVIFFKKLSKLEKRLYIIFTENNIEPYLNLKEEIKSLLREKNEVKVIKYVRSKTDFGLLYAKRYVDFVKKSVD